LRQDSATIRSLRREYSITTQEEEWILQGISPQAGILQKAEFLLAKLSEGRDCDRALHHPRLHEHHAAVTVLHKSLHHKQNQLVQSILEVLVTSENHSQGLAIAQSLKQLAPQCVAEQINQEPCKNQLSPEIFQRLTLAEESPIALTTEPSTQETLSHLNDLLHTYNPLVQATALYLFAQCDPEQAQVKIWELQQASPPPLVQETSEQLLSLPPSPPLNALPRLEKLVYLSNSDFFHPVRIGTLMTLGDRAEIRTYELGGVITDAGDTCRELLLLIEGEAQIHYPLTEGVRVESLYPGQVLDELEVLGHSTLENTIIADSEKTRILAIPVAAFDDLLADDADFAHRVLELESRQIHRLMQSITR
jgi:hypothetical protein